MTLFKKTLTIWLLLSAIGTLLVILLPDDLFGNRVILKFSDEHGPTLADSIGIVLILGAWTYYLVTVWIRRHILQTKRATKWLLLIIAVCIVGCIVATTNNWNMLLIFASTAALLAQIALGFLALAPRSNNHA